MDKKLKKKLIAYHREAKTAFPDLYDQRWVEQAADKGWQDVLDALKKSYSEELAHMVETTPVFPIIYYSAFENALNTFFFKVLEDHLTTCQLCLEELHKLTASIITKTSPEDP